MYSSKMYELGAKPNVIRKIFEYSQKRSAEIGEENVFDFCIGNPNIPAPEGFHQAIRELLSQMDDYSLHGYTSNAGDQEARRAIADNLNARYQTSFHKDNLYMTCGATASLKICVTAMCEDEDEFITFTPFFPEYRIFVETAGACLVTAETDPDSFQIDFDKLKVAFTGHTKGIIINSPNNPSGVVFSEKSIIKLAALLKEKSAEYGHPIFLISDEPYRELVYDGLRIPFLTKYYDNTVICYSFSKCMSVPGERIGYILVPDEMEDHKHIYAAICGAGRALGYVCAPSLMQHVIARCAGEVADVEIYRKNRDFMYQALTSYGYECVYPNGAFYMFVKAMEKDASAFCEKAKEEELLLVPGDSFGCPGYVRISYCVPMERIRRALPAFQALAERYRK